MPPIQAHSRPDRSALDPTVVPASHISRQPVRSTWTLDRLRHERAIALGHVLENSTRNVYNSATVSYLNFCKLHNFPIEPTSDTLSFYAVWMCGSERPVKPSTVVGYLSGICSNLEPFFPNVRNIRTAPLVSKTLVGLKKRFGSSAKQKRAISVQEISDVQSILSLSSNYDDCLFLALLSVGFHGLHRLGELCWPNDKENRSYRRLIPRHSVRVEDAAFSYVLPAHKADPGFNGSHIRIVKRWDSIDPLPIFNRYLSARDNRFPGFLELWLDSKGRTPTKQWFQSYLRRFCAPDITGHSLRSGGATALALLGVPDSYIQKIGRWSSDAWQGYVQAHPVVLHALMSETRQNI
ncbi:hypothetical protein RSOLAG1IB_00012 [Rhizoctonia solani AG-1 IB]|uniref:Tyr recombinase domain-containing protein n=1 Tax=Thanatephorus cucumeris (strain AG1-IB / isolate 7/3/14) TaxID=1108050 RepID=M5CEK2_THACB|nr:hypothetical protein BN14_11832 [Rhizoctonia solani AG-1 IB]CEL51477.1 hypothetical protein RSOLAG1IB_00012 [Rhizoctonia solani AG-1 IB]